jgi:FMN phosphatase YigB (HAD superfamily)
MRVKGIIFDWGNTLVDYPLADSESQLNLLSEWLLDEAVKLTPRLRPQLENLALSRAALLEFNSEDPTHHVKRFRSRLETILKIELNEVESSKLEDGLCRRIFSRSTPMPFVNELLTTLNRKHLSIGIVSNLPWGTSPGLWRNEVIDYPFERPLQAMIVFCGDVGFRKPDPRPFVECLRRLGLHGNDVLVVGDSLSSDMAGAKAAGCQALWLNQAGNKPSQDDWPSAQNLGEVLSWVR